ncbi:MAG: hypothetical protein ACXWQO_14750 [Bdellovibrionota bacterium]
MKTTFQLKKTAAGILWILAFAIGFSAATAANAGVTGYVTFHNSRSESIRALVNWGFRGAVAANSSRSFLVGDQPDATTWLSAETSSGYELKRESYSSARSDVDIWVD